MCKYAVRWRLYVVVTALLCGVSGYAGAEPVVIQVWASGATKRTWKRRTSAYRQGLMMPRCIISLPMKTCRRNWIWLWGKSTGIEILDALTDHLGVRFVYEGEMTPAAGAMKLNIAALASLSDELLSDLEQALSLLDIGAVNRVIDAIRPHHLSLADALRSVANDLQFARMLEIIRAAAGKTDPGDKTCRKI